MNKLLLKYKIWTFLYDILNHPYKHLTLKTYSAYFLVLLTKYSFMRLFWTWCHDKRMSK